MVEGSKQTLIPAVPGVLVRITEEGAVVDFGSNGRHILPIEQTDVIAQAERLRQANLAEHQASLHTQIGDKFWRWDGENLVRLGSDYFKDKKYLVFLYAEPDDASSIERVRQFSRAYEDIEERNPTAEVVLMSAASKVQPFFDQDAPTFPVMTWHMSSGYIYALDQQPGERPAVVITDFSNRIIHHPDQGSPDWESVDLAEWIHNIIEQDQQKLEAEPLRQKFLERE